MENPREVSRHPLQPLVEDSPGVFRFKANMIVQYLVENGGIDLNKIAAMPFSREDRVQLAQLIGYSLSGFGELSYVDDEDYEVAAETVHSGWVECGLPWRTYDGSPSFESNDCCQEGVLVETDYGQFLLGHINTSGGVCDCCREFKSDTIIRRFRVVWWPEHAHIDDRTEENGNAAGNNS